jgi:hypothetical protein
MADGNANQLDRRRDSELFVGRIAGRPRRCIRLKRSSRSCTTLQCSAAIGPVLGQRVRVEVEPAFGSVPFTDVRVDARRYWMPCAAVDRRGAR